MHGLAKDYAGRLQFEVVKYNEGDSQQRIEKYGLIQHGMILCDDQQNLVWSESGHKQTREGVVAALEKALGG